MITFLAFLVLFIVSICLLIARHDSQYRASYDYDKEIQPKKWKGRP